MKDGHPKISDFGLSRTVDAEVSMTLTFCGSPALCVIHVTCDK